MLMYGACKLLYARQRLLRIVANYNAPLFRGSLTEIFMIGSQTDIKMTTCQHNCIALQKGLTLTLTVYTYTSYM